MFKIVKTKITQDEFIKEVKTLFPNKFTEAGLEVLFDYIDQQYGEQELDKISKDFEEWTFEKYRDYLVERFDNTQDQNNKEEISIDDLKKFLYEDVGEDSRDEWAESVVGFTNSTIIFTTYYTSDLENELKRMYKRLRTIPLEQFYKEFGCEVNSIMEVFSDSFPLSKVDSKNYYLIFRGKTDREITFEQYSF